MAARPTVVLTRPLTEALHWQQLLQDRGVDTAVLPLIEIAPTHDAATQSALAAAREQLGRYRALMFVSPNAVRGLLAAPGMPAALLQAVHAGHTRCWAPGPGTCQALVNAGVPETAVDSPPADAAQFDSESLWAVVATQPHAGDRVLIVRGASPDAAAGPQGSGREWLARQLQAQGVQVALLGVYTRQCPTATPQWRTTLEQCCSMRSVWLFSSSEAIAHLQQLAPQQDWSGQQALTTHPRITQAAQAAGFGLVRECRPGVADVSASIESWS